ncbi:MAG: ATPase [Sulfobacillus thermosulfidooxidans]|uniref:ATPase n=1 Tax=Sulfobacillus thermotolerans TaxID=338644 RepID=A0ABM6RSV4_9FIRM|nr:ATPase [Sulfobacillus sp. hq2]AUW94516.1 hypothetical protein BXT84_11660 [Sulfobacillus thermotolerans]MCY0908048.1 ATPase [Sulfobacillus thermotolerans]POB09190.1 ATPase [Sulfobacillus sp. hq2]PSR36912.1 MAG: ATPase [Sulfobacillus thermosulfidooxidans]
MTSEPIVSELTVLLDRFQQLIQQSRKLPWTHRVLLDEAELTTLVAQIQHVLPEEVKQARWVVQERDRLLEDAHKEAQQIVETAREQAAKLAEESEILQEARRKADQIVDQARTTAREIHRAARVYADEILAGLVTELNHLSQSLEANRAELREE